MAVFKEQMREMLRKYQMLWFVLDTYHGQRYFFICGCNRTVMKSWRFWDAGEAAMILKLAAYFIPAFRSFSRICRLYSIPAPAPDPGVFSPILPHGEN
jgi:hypothetical protein